MRRSIFFTPTEVIIVSTRDNTDGTETTSVATIRACTEAPTVVDDSETLPSTFLGDRWNTLNSSARDRFSAW